MRKLFFLVFVIILTSSLTLAQSENSEIKKGSKAILFGFNGLSSLNASSYNGGIGGKYFIKSNLVLRGTFLFTNSKSTDPYNPPPGSNQSGLDGYDKAKQLGFEIAVEKHRKNKKISPYLGCGFGFSSTSTESKNAVPVSQFQTTYKNYTVNVPGGSFRGNTTLDIFGILGFEYFVTDIISLSAEYQMGFSKTSLKDQEEINANLTITNKGGSARTLGIKTSGFITLAIYF